MLEISFQNQIEDIHAFADFFASKTPEGQKAGKTTFIYRQLGFLFVILTGSLFWGSVTHSHKVGQIVFFGLLFFTETLVFAGTKFKPYYSYAKEIFLNQNKLQTEKQKRLFSIPKKLIANEEYFEVSSEISLQRCQWVCIEKIELSSNLIIIYMGGFQAYLIPKRAFTSEQEHNGFSGNLHTLKQNYDKKNSMGK